MSSPLVLIILFILFIFLGRGTWRVYGNYAEAKRELKQIETELKQLKDREKELDITQDRIGSEEGNDYEIRKRLEVAMPDERVIHIIQPASSTLENITSNDAR